MVLLLLLAARTSTNQDAAGDVVEALFEPPHEVDEELFRLTGDPLLGGMTTTLSGLEPLILDTPLTGGYFGLLP